MDRNRHKDLCARKARAQGIATARLPVSQHFKLTSSAVLTVNQARPALPLPASLGSRTHARQAIRRAVVIVALGWHSAPSHDQQFKLTSSAVLNGE